MNVKNKVDDIENWNPGRKKYKCLHAKPHHLLPCGGRRATLWELEEGLPALGRKAEHLRPGCNTGIGLVRGSTPCSNSGEVGEEGVYARDRMRPRKLGVHGLFGKSIAATLALGSSS